MLKPYQKEFKEKWEKKITSPEFLEKARVPYKYTGLKDLRQIIVDEIEMGNCAIASEYTGIIIMGLNRWKERSNRGRIRYVEYKSVKKVLKYHLRIIKEKYEESQCPIPEELA